MMVQLSESPVDHAQESDGVIIHVSASGEPIGIEIQRGREFLLGSLTSLVNEEEVRLP